MARRCSSAKSSVSFASSLAAQPHTVRGNILPLTDTDSDGYEDLEKSCTSSSSSNEDHSHRFAKQNDVRARRKGASDLESRHHFEQASNSQQEYARKNADQFRQRNLTSETMSDDSRKASRGRDARDLASSGAEFNDEISKLSKKLKNIESRLDKNERRADKELRKLCLQRQDELSKLKQLEWLGARDSFDLEPAVHRSMPTVGLQRSATDFRGPALSRIYPSASAEDCRQAGKPVTRKSDTSGARKASFGQRLQKSSSAVLRAATSSLTSIGKPSLHVPHIKSERKSQDYSSMDSVDNLSVAAEDLYVFPKTRRSPLRILGNFVDDKIFRGRLGSGKSTHRSSAEATNLRSGSLNETLLQREQEALRRSLASAGEGAPASSARVSFNDDVFDSRRYSSAEIALLKNEGRKLRAFSSPDTREIMEILRRPLSDPDDDSVCSKSTSQSSCGTDSGTAAPRTQIKPEALAEIEAFERMAYEFLRKNT